MGRIEKIAWYNLAIFGLVLAVFLYVYYVHAVHFDLGMRVAYAIRSFGLLIFIALGPVLFREQLKEGKLGEGMKSKSSLPQKLITTVGIIIGYIFIRTGAKYMEGVDYVRNNPEYFLIFLFLCILAIIVFLLYRYKKSQENSYIDKRTKHI